MEERADDNDNAKSQKDISSKFLDLIFEGFKRLENHERRIRNNCEDLYDFIIQENITNFDVGSVVIENFEAMKREFRTILSNCKPIMNKTEYDNLISKLNKIDKISKENQLWKIVVDDKRHTKRKALTSLYDRLSEELCKLRGDLIDSLSHIIFAIEKKGKETKD